MRLDVAVRCTYNACSKHPRHDEAGCFWSIVNCYRCNSKRPFLYVDDGSLATGFGERRLKCKGFRPGEKAMRRGREWPWWSPRPKEGE